MSHNTQKNEMDIDGRVLYVSPPKYVSERLTLMTLVLEVFDGNYSSPAPFTFKNARMDSLKGIKEGDWINCQYKLGGFKGKGDGEPKYYAENIGVTVIKA